jgi:hypothetical protein
VTALSGLNRRSAGERDLSAPGLVLAGAGVAVLAGLAEPRYGTICLGICGALVIFGVIARLARSYGAGVIVGLLVLGAVDALPGPNAETVHVVRTVTLADVFIILLGAVLVRVAIVHPEARRRPSRHELMLRIWSGVLIAFWLVAGVRAWFGQSVPLTNGLFWGREFFYLALLAPLLVRVLSIPRVRSVTLAVCGVGLCVVSAAQVATVASGHALSLFVHLTRVGSAEGLVRLYSGADWLIPAGIPFGLGLVLFSATRRDRIAGAILLGFSFSAFAVELTRVLYIGLVVGLSLTTFLWFAVGDATGRIGRRRGLQLGVTAAVMVAALLFIRPAVISGSVVNGVVVRATSVFADLSGPTTQDPDLTLRLLERSDLQEYLGSSWLFGKGFLDPSYYYVAQVVNGSIMNPDVGYLSAVMTIGAAGTVVLYLPFLYLALTLIYLRLRRRTATTSWLAFGSLAWILMAMIASVTLAIMLTPLGAVPSAGILALACICAAEAVPATSEVRTARRFTAGSDLAAPAA